MRSSKWPALRPWRFNLESDISDTLSVRGYVFTPSIWMLWGTEIFRAYAAGKEERMKVASTSCDLVPMSNGFGLPNRAAIHQADINTFAARCLNTQGLNNSCLKSPASTLVDLTFQSRALRSFSLNQLRNLSL